MELEQRVEDLQATVEQLRHTVSELKQQLASLRVGGDATTMRRHVRCPACGGGKIIHAPKVLDRTDGSRETMALAQPSVWRSRTVGQFQVYICVGCGLAEWYVQDPEAVAQEELFSVVQAPEPGQDGPYR